MGLGCPLELVTAREPGAAIPFGAELLALRTMRTRVGGKSRQETPALRLGAAPQGGVQTRPGAEQGPSPSSTKKQLLGAERKAPP